MSSRHLADVGKLEVVYPHGKTIVWRLKFRLHLLLIIIGWNGFLFHTLPAGHTTQITQQRQTVALHSKLFASCCFAWMFEFHCVEWCTCDVCFHIHQLMKLSYWLKAVKKLLPWAEITVTHELIHRSKGNINAPLPQHALRLEQSATSPSAWHVAWTTDQSVN